MQAAREVAGDGGVVEARTTRQHFLFLHWASQHTNPPGIHLRSNSTVGAAHQPRST